MTTTDSVTITQVVLAGAGGNLGRHVLEALLSSGRFKVTVLVQKNAAPNEYPPEVQTISVDYDKIDSLLHALQSKDAVVSTLGKSTGLAQQFKLIDAAAAAGVKRFLPSEFGADLQHAEIRTFPIYRTKIEIEQYLEQKARETSLTYTFIYNSVLLEFGLESGSLADFSWRTVSFFDEGDATFSATRMSTAAEAVVSVLTKYDATRNRSVRIQDFSMTPRELLDLVQSLDPLHTWTPFPVDTKKMVKDAEAELRLGHFNPKVFAAYATRGVFAPGFAGGYDADNELLGITGLGKEELGRILRTRVQKGS